MLHNVLLDHQDCIDELKESFPQFLEFGRLCRARLTEIVAHCVENPYIEYKGRDKYGEHKWQEWFPSIKWVATNRGESLLEFDTTAEALWKIYKAKTYWAKKMTHWEKKYNDLMEKENISNYLRELSDAINEYDIKPRPPRKCRGLVTECLGESVPMGVPTPDDYWIFS